MHTTKSKKKKSYRVFMQRKFPKNICFIMHFGFNNQFIKAMRTRPIFQKNTQKICCFVLVSMIMNLYVKRTPDIKKMVLL
jgi:hypothetical protein